MPFLEGEAVFYTDEDYMRRMMSALLGVSGTQQAGVPLRLRIADGGNGELLHRAWDASGRDGVPLLLYGRKTEDLPRGDFLVYCLPRPFLWDEFLSAAQQLVHNCSAVRTLSPADGAGLAWERETKTVRAGDACIRLSTREAQVFSALYDAFPEVVSDRTLEALFAGVKGNSGAVYIAHLRKKLSALPLITAIPYLRGKGYALLIGTPYEEQNRIYTENSEENQ